MARGALHAPVAVATVSSGSIAGGRRDDGTRAAGAAPMHKRASFLSVSAMLLTSLVVVGCGDDDGPPATADAGRTTGDSGTIADAGSGDDDSGTGDVDGGEASDDAGSTDAGEPLPTAVATIEATDESGDGAIAGTVTFTQRGDAVEVVYALTSCPDGAHPTHLHQGDGCDTRRAQGMHWDGVRGEGIPDIECAGGVGALTYTRTADDPDTAWSIGGDAATDILGHPVIIHGAADTEVRIGCGVIESAP
jgi:Cu/Zn superoxide dismutase